MGGTAIVSESAIIRTEALVKNYTLGPHVVHALRGVTVSIEPGEFVAVMGPSGLGQVDLHEPARAASTRRPPAATSWTVGTSPGSTATSWRARATRRSASSSRCSTCCPGRARSRTSSCRCSTPDLPARDRRRRARERLASVGLAEREHHHPNELSGGQQQRVAIARSLVNDPAVILADEPTGNLDTRTSVEIMALLQRLNRAGLTIVLVTHEPDIATYAGRVLTFRDGRLMSDERRPEPSDAAAALAALPGRGRGAGMMTLQSIRIALRSLRVNKLRSALTMLGIIIGVGAVITMVAVGAGASARVAEQIQSLGSNLIIVLSGSVNTAGVRIGQGSQLTITEDDSAAIAREVPAVQVSASVGPRQHPGRLRQPQLVHRRAGRDRRLLRGARLDGGQRAADRAARTSTARPRSRCSVRRRRRICSARPIPSARSSASRRCRSP